MKAAGWLTALIERARTCGVDNEGIAAALEGSIVFRPVTIARDERDRLVGTMADGDITLDDLFKSSDADRRTR